MAPTNRIRRSENRSRVNARKVQQQQQQQPAPAPVAFGQRLVSVTNSIRAASRRRRARTTNMHSNLKGAATASACTSPAPAAAQAILPTGQTNTVRCAVPPTLARPPCPPVDRATFAASVPDMADMPVEYAQDKLELHGNAMHRVLQSVQARPSRTELPRMMPIIVEDTTSGPPPTAILAVHRSPALQQGAGATKVTLYPVHTAVLAAHCARLPALPTMALPQPAAARTVPVVPLALPLPEHFPALLHFLYTRDAGALAARLLSIDAIPASDEAYAAVIETLGARGADAILRHGIQVVGVWKNACALGVNDDHLWLAIDTMWEMIHGALAEATNA